MDQQQHMIYDIVEILEGNLQFWRTGPTNDSRHFVGPEVLHALAWTATSLVLPIFLSATNEVVKNKLKGGWPILCRFLQRVGIPNCERLGA